MSYPWFEEYCLAKKGASREFKEEWGCFRFMLGGKMFIMDGADNTGRKCITLKLEPADGELMREVYPGSVTAGYYMNKTHWNSVYRDGDVPDDELRRMADESYRLILQSLPKKAQKEILEG